MKAICMPTQCVSLTSCEQHGVSALTAGASDFVKQFVALFNCEMIMTKNDTRTKRQFADRTYQIVTKSRVSHKPDFGKGLTAAHPPAYSAAL